MSAADDDTLDPRLSVLIGAPFDPKLYAARVARVVERYERLALLARTSEPRQAARLELALLRDHPSALREREAADGAELGARLEAARAELDRLRAGAAVPAPVDEPARTRVLAVADVEWLMRELRLLRRWARRRPPAMLVEAYLASGRPDPLPAPSEGLARAVALIPRGRLLAAAARLAGARHGVSGVHAWLAPRPAAAPSVPVRVRVCHEGELVEGRGLRAEVCGRAVALFRDEGIVRALDDACPHRGGPLHRGDLERGAVLCPLHGWAFDLRTGVMRGNPRVAVSVHEVEVEGTDVFVRAPEGAR